MLFAYFLSIKDAAYYNSDMLMLIQYNMNPIIHMIQNDTRHVWYVFLWVYEVTPESKNGFRMYGLLNYKTALFVVIIHLNAC